MSTERTNHLVPSLLEKKRHRAFFSPTILPLVFFLLSSAITFLVWTNAHRSQIQNLDHETAVTIEQVKLRLEAWVDSRAAILQHMASVWNTETDTDLFLFEAEAHEIMHLYPGFQAINYVDDQWVIRVVVPEATNQAALNKDLHLHPDPGVALALQEALDSGQIKRSPLIHLLQGKPGFAVYLPIREENQRLRGVLNGVFVMDKLVNSCLSDEKLISRFAITIETLAGEPAFEHHPDGFHEDRNNPGQSLDLRIVDKNWRLKLIPLSGVGLNLWTASNGLLMTGSLGLILALSLLLRAYLLRLNELRRSREEYKVLVNNQAEVVIKVDPDQRMTFVSPSITKMIGRVEGDLLARNPAEFVHPEDRPTLKEFLDDVATGAGNENVVLRLKTSQSWIWTSWSGSPLYSEQGSYDGLVAVGRDITQNRELEFRLRQGQRLQAVGQLAGGVAHDFNNIIQAILGYVGFVKGELPPDSDAYDDLSQAELAAGRAAALTRQLLAFSRRQMLKPVLLNLDKVIEDLLPMLRRLLGESLDLVFQPTDGLPWVMADRSQLEQILLNLSVNARDSITDETGTIRIQTSSRVLDEDFCRTHHWAEPGHWVRLDLLDSGKGMDEDTLTQVFEPFFTTKEMGKGTGLGLATVYGIVKQHEGLIDVTSTPGQGTCFSIFLKASNGLEAQESDSPESETAPGVEKILLVEDEEMVRNLTARILEGAGYGVQAADDGVSGYKLWSENMDEFDLVIMDVVMPNMGGRELSRKIRQDRPGTRILFISGFDSESFRQPLDPEAPADLLLKPFNKESLLERVRQILDR